MDSKNLKTLFVKNIKLYWSLPVAFVFLLVLIFGAIAPIYRQIHTLRMEIMVEKNELETKYIRRQTIRRTLLALTRIKEDWPKLFNSFYPKTGQEITFLNTFEKTADKFNLEQTLSLEPSLGSPLSANIQVIPIQITLMGQYHNVISYLHEIENKAIIVHLKDIKINRINSNGTVHAFARFNSYWHKQ